MTTQNKQFGCDFKRTYPTRSAAMQVARIAGWKGHFGPPQEPYRCHFCGKWHLGSVDPFERDKRIRAKSRKF